MPSAAVLGRTRNAAHSAGSNVTAHFASTTTFSRRIAEKHPIKDLQVWNSGFARQARFTKPRIVPSDAGSYGTLH